MSEKASEEDLLVDDEQVLPPGRRQRCLVGGRGDHESLGWIRRSLPGQRLEVLAACTFDDFYEIGKSKRKRKEKPILTSLLSSTFQLVGRRHYRLGGVDLVVRKQGRLWSLSEGPAETEAPLLLRIPIRHNVQPRVCRDRRKLSRWMTARSKVKLVLSSDAFPETKLWYHSVTTSLEHKLTLQ